MISVLECKFLRLNEYERKDKTKFYTISVLIENKKSIIVNNFFVDNEIALNLKNCSNLSKLHITFDIFFTVSNGIKYKINKIAIV